MPHVAFRLVLTNPPQLRSVGDGVEALLGFSGQDLLSAKVRLQDRVHRDDASLADCLFSPNLDKPSGPIRLRLRHADGRIVCSCGHFSKERTADGAVALALHLADARTAKEPGDAALISNFKSLIEQSTGYLYIKNRNHVMLAASRTLAELNGSSAGSPDVVGVTDYDLHPEKAADEYYGLEERAFSEGQCTTLIHQVPVGDGMRWIHNRKYPINGPGGEIIGLFGVALDVTENVEIEHRLRASEESLREAQRIARLGSYLLDIDSGAWTSSDVLDEIFGIDQKYERTVSGWSALLHPDDRAPMVAYFRDEVLGQRKPFDREYRVIRQTDGATRWVHGLGRLELDGHGRPARMFGTIRDVTDAREARESLRESQHLLQLFIAHAPAALAMFDREMRYLAVSRRWLEMHSLQDGDLIGRSHYEVMPEIPEVWREEHRRGLTGESLPASERQLTRANGSIQWLRREILPWRTGDGSVGGVLVCSEDITQRKQAEADLYKSQELLRLFVDYAPASIIMLDREMRYLAVSRRFLETESLVGQEIIGRSLHEVIPHVPEQWKEEQRRALAGEELHPPDAVLPAPGGGKRWLRRELRPWFKDDGSIGGIISLAQDITEEKESEERLRLAATVFMGAREGIVISDEQGTIVDVNDAFTRITGYARDEVLGQDPRILQSGLQSGEFYEKMWSCLMHEGHWSGEMWNRSKAGDIYAAAITVNAMRDGKGKTTHYVALFSDISEIKEHEQQLEHIAHFDALTGLPNRALFADRLRQAMGQAQRTKHGLAVAHFDLDGFKAINDKYGNTVGDGLLTAIAFRMKRALREGDTLARLGGDEFAAVMLDLDNEDAAEPALNHLLEAAAEDARIGDVTLRVTASAGVTFYPQTEEVDADVLLRQGGQAMYQAKLAGGNRFSKFDPGQDLLTRSRHESLEHIRQDLAARRFVLYYQPIVNMRSGQVVGLEALVRWQHADRGLLPPGLFLPVIEDHPLLVELGQWVIESALTQIESWKSKGLALTVSVNVSAIELQQPDFVDRLRAHLAAHPLVEPSDLALEVVETTALQDVMQTSQVLTACRGLGVSIALDDFGIGYSSLTYLRRLPANILKIDQSFVRDMLDEPENLNILEGVMGLASVFRRDVIVEGVETVDHGLMLLQMGCEIAQGYGIARPMPAEEFPNWMATWRPDPRWAEVPQVHATNRPVLIACVEHRAWLSAFEACLQGRRTLPPSLDASQCRIAHWLDAEKQSARGTLLSIQAIETLHRQLHGLAAEILESQAEGRNPEGLARLEQLHILHDKCLSRLRRFSRIDRGARAKRSAVAAPKRS